MSTFNLIKPKKTAKKSDRKLVSQIELMRLFNYDPAGYLINRTSRNARSVTGHRAGTPYGSVYWRVKIGYQCYSLHRLIFCYFHGYWPDEVDHINGDKSDNRIENLRAASRKENGSNRLKRKLSTYSKYKGVTFHKNRGRYQAAITHNYKYIYLGFYDNEEDAAHAYNRAAENYFGEFARLNVIGG